MPIPENAGAGKELDFHFLSVSTIGGFMQFAFGAIASEATILSIGGGMSQLITEYRFSYRASLQSWHWQTALRRTRITRGEGGQDQTEIYPEGIVTCCTE
jgi:hypothetical protein